MNIDVVVPVYNVKPWLSDCLDSLVKQTSQFNKIIIVDDGSNDGSETICDSYAEKYSNIEVIHQENKGLGKARNVGIAHVSAPFFLLVDSDDYLSVHTVRVLSEKLLENDYDALYFNGESFNSDGEIHEKEKYIWGTKRINEGNAISGKDFFMEVYPDNYICTSWLTLYSLPKWTNNGFLFPEGVYHEDICIAYEYMDKAKCVGYIPEILYHRRYRPNSIMTSIHRTIDKNLKDLSKLYCDNFLYIKETINQNSELHKEKERIYIERACRYIKYLYDTYYECKDVANIWVDRTVSSARAIKGLFYLNLKEWEISDLTIERKFVVDLYKDNWLLKESLSLGFDREVAKEIVRRYIEIMEKITDGKVLGKIGVYGCGLLGGYFVDFYEWFMNGDLSRLVFIETEAEQKTYREKHIFSISDNIPKIDVLLITSNKYAEEMISKAKEVMPNIPVSIVFKEEIVKSIIKHRDYNELFLDSDIKEEVFNEAYSNGFYNNTSI